MTSYDPRTLYKSALFFLLPGIAAFAWAIFTPGWGGLALAMCAMAYIITVSIVATIILIVAATNHERQHRAPVENPQA